MALRPPGDERRRVPRAPGARPAAVVAMGDGGLVVSEYPLIDVSVQAVAVRVGDPRPELPLSLAVVLPSPTPLVVLGQARPFDPDRPGVLVVDVVDRDGPVAERIAEIVARRANPDLAGQD